MHYEGNQPLQIPILPPKKHNTPMNIIVVIISIIMICTIFTFIYMYSYTPIYRPTPTTPTGALNFTETTPGNFSGRLITLAVYGINLSDVSVKIIDDRGFDGSLERLFNHATLEVDGGLRCTFEDINSNKRLDIEDKFYMWNVGVGTIIKLYYIKTRAVIALYTFE